MNTGEQRAPIWKHAALLLAAQVVVTPLSVLVNAVMARKLGPSEFGELFLISTFISFGLLFIEWGQGAVLTARSAQARESAGELLGTSLAFRTLAALAVGALMLIAARLVAGAEDFSRLLAYATGAALFGSLAIACQDVVRGFERIDFAAASYVGYQLLVAAAVVSVLLLGGHLPEVIGAQLACSVLGFCVMLVALRPLGVPRLALRRRALGHLIDQGTPFLGLGLALVLQPSVDALMLAEYAAPEAIGWHAAARKLIGILVYPVTAIIGGLYPTLCRLHANDRNAYNQTAQSALAVVALISVPVAVGCALFPDLGVRLFSRTSFRPAEDNLRVLALFLLPAYFSMPLGTCLASAGLTRSWSVAQLGCVAVSALLDPVLIQYFQAHAGNGGIGVGVAAVISEVAMLAFALFQVPRGVLVAALGRRFLLALLAGGAMAATGYALAGASSFVAAPLSLCAYGLCLRATRAIDRDEERRVLAYIRQKLAFRRSASA